jgi:succinoglycan biosynthesis transport protein ExoP
MRQRALDSPDGDGKQNPLSPAIRSRSSNQPEAIYPRTHISAEGTSDGLLEYWRILRRHKIALLASSLAGAALGLLLALLQTPVYEARVSLEIQALNENFMNAKEIDPHAVNYSADAYMQTQIKLLQADSLAGRALGELSADQKLAAMQTPQPYAVLTRFLKLPQSSPQSVGDALEMASKSVKVRGSGMTRVVEVLCTSTNPGIAAKFANTLANDYIQQNLEARWETGQLTTEWLTKNLKTIRTRLEKSEEQLFASAQKAGLMLTDKENLAEEKLKRLQTELLSAQADRLLKQSRFELTTSGPLDALPQTIDDPSLRAYQSKLTDLRRELADLSSALTPAHPKVLRMKPQISEVEASLARERSNVISRIQNEYTAARRREELVDGEYSKQSRLVAQQGGKMVQYNLIKREVDANRQLYEGVLQKVKEAGMASASGYTNARIVDLAKPPEYPAKPDLVLASTMGLFVGSFICFALVMVRYQSGHTIQSPGDVSSYLDVAELGVIPNARIDAGKSLSYPIKRDATLKIGDDPVNGNSALAAWKTAPSPMSESFHATLASIMFSRRTGMKHNVLIVTSPSPAEGKTMACTNLAIACARVGQRVLLIDGDLRRSRLHRVFNIPSSPGFSDLLFDTKPIDQCEFESIIHRTAIKGLSVLPSGESVGPVVELLHSPRLSEMITHFRKSFDAVFIDAPPILHLSDARLLGRQADAVILVVRAGRTTVETAYAALHRMAQDGIPVLGTILNDWNPDHSPYRFEYYQNYVKGTVQ